MGRMKLVRCLQHDAYATPRRQNMTLLDFANFVQWGLGRLIPTKTKTIRVRGFGVL